MSKDIVKRIQKLNTERAVALNEKAKAEQVKKDLILEMKDLGIDTENKLEKTINKLEETIKKQEKELENDVSKIEKELEARTTKSSSDKN